MRLKVGNRPVNVSNAPWVGQSALSFSIEKGRYVYDETTGLITSFHIIDRGQVFRNFLVEASGPFPTNPDVRNALQAIGGFLANVGTGMLVSGIMNTNPFVENAAGNWAGGQAEDLVRSLIGDLTRSDLYYFDYDNKVATINCGLLV